MGLAGFWNVAVAGVGLFSDGYINSVLGSVSTMIRANYNEEDLATSAAFSNLAAIVFVGTVIGQLSFGFIADRFGRKVPLTAAPIILVVFSVLCACSTGSTPAKLVQMLTAMRFFIGIGIGAEYPASSVTAAESSQEVQSGWRQAIFISVTNSAIDWGFVAGAFVPWLLVVICGTSHHGINLAWRLSLGLGVLIPLTVFFLRFRLKEPEAFRHTAISRAKTPWLLVFKKYGRRVAAIAVVWFLYDFISYPFGIYSSTILSLIIPNGTLAQQFGWNTVINLFFIPGTMLGAPLSDLLGPARCLMLFVFIQGCFGFALAGGYSYFVQHVGGFAVMYGLFLAFGEAGPGNNIGLVAAKAYPSNLRGRLYSMGAAIGKMGAFAGSYAFTDLIKDFGGANTVHGQTGPIWIASGMAILSGLIAWTFFPKLTQDCILDEDTEWLSYLKANGYDTTELGVATTTNGAAHVNLSESATIEMKKV
eukprot:Phypoly_transcript_06350.p1 GENE.Phypoly_transcript_06350~~Phypoly_transcript_06350.p1  ORF type:complete len:476 (+),score=50.75 Phypoly_transcript_06350:299-1726(+)